jgi:hypothetical protein
MLRGFIILLGVLCAAVTSAAAETPIEHGIKARHRPAGKSS